MRDLGNIRALNAGIEKTYGVSEAVQRILAPVGDGQLLRECLRRGLIVDDRVSDKGLDALHDVVVSHGIRPDLQPNDETVAALRASRRGDVERITTLDALFEAEERHRAINE